MNNTLFARGVEHQIHSAVNSYDIYYSDGGHCGPYSNLLAAYRDAKSKLAKSYATSIEIRPNNSGAIGAYYYTNLGSFYLWRGQKGLEPVI